MALSAYLCYWHHWPWCQQLVLPKDFYLFFQKFYLHFLTFNWFTLVYPSVPRRLNLKIPRWSFSKVYYFIFLYVIFPHYFLSYVNDEKRKQFPFQFFSSHVILQKQNYCVWLSFCTVHWLVASFPTMNLNQYSCNFPLISVSGNNGCFIHSGNKAVGMIGRGGWFGKKDCLLTVRKKSQRRNCIVL